MVVRRQGHRSGRAAPNWGDWAPAGWGGGPAWGGGSMGLLLACRVGLPRPRSPTPILGSLGVGLRLGGKG